MRIESQPAYILHTRNYRDSSLIVDFLTPDYGRVSGVVKGVRSNSKSAKQRRSILQPFVSLLISWSGKSELKTITQFESRGVPIALQGKQLFSGLYVNELLSRLLQADEQHSEIYTLYEWVSKSLLDNATIDVVLRHFELSLLSELGYGFDLSADSESGAALKADQQYRFYPDRGFVLLEPNGPITASVFRGEDILAIASGDFNEPARRAAKLLCRQALQAHLGNKPLRSRELFSPTPKNQ
ncbi:DNA repair protein RecO [Oceanicoccus sagamiensis]|uniref:DNA repair protein RecO n=1 Tax=Oceanicoccus sagamiensis TaxID=716816 RepID=A0A1X9NIP3_9GAMM|nr:DNA repair protein RecO [Oceanicoccus sagamiensis]ARN75359.1 DNA repair protein RecO [Oceanicoccus sagamiensis]